MTANQAALNGARKIIQHCLGLGKGQELLILGDETTVEVTTILAEAASQLGVQQTAILLPTSIQRQIPHDLRLSLSTWTVAQEARAILTCVSGAPESFPFRDYILDNWRSARTRIGHMPGANLDVLTLASVDFEQLIGDCRRLELAMAHGRQLDFYSTAADGSRHRLTADIGGWDRLPVASDGVIGDGAWGNVPSGETYIAPVEGSAEGSVVINGSIPDRLLAPGEEIVLRFAGGRLVGIEPQASPAARWLIETHIDPAKARQDANWDNLAEIGVGVNPVVKQLTGNMMFDEKAAGTAHVAIGSSTMMGGRVESSIHCDMVVCNPLLLIDGKRIMADGRLQIAERDWYENYQRVSLAHSPLRTAGQVMRSGVQSQIGADGRMWRWLRSEPGRLSRCLVGDEETARLAGQIYDRLPEGREWIAIYTLAQQSMLGVETVRRVLHIMWDYALVQIRD